MVHKDKRNTSRKRSRNNSRRDYNNATLTKNKYVLTEQDKVDNEAIKVLKLNKTECPMCHKPILDVATCLSDRDTLEPVHFDCVLKKLTEQENLLPDQKIVYVGNGNFAVVVFENPRDLRHFKIIRQIEWEKRDQDVDWRKKISELYSQVH